MVEALKGSSQADDLEHHIRGDLSGKYWKSFSYAVIGLLSIKLHDRVCLYLLICHFTVSPTCFSLSKTDLLLYVYSVNNEIRNE